MHWEKRRKKVTTRPSCLAFQSSVVTRDWNLWIYWIEHIDVRVVVLAGSGLMGAWELDGSWWVMVAWIIVPSLSFFGRTICIRWAVTWRKRFSTSSPVFAETKYDNMSRSLAKRWCFSALTARKCSRSSAKRQLTTMHRSCKTLISYSCFPLRQITAFD